MTAAEAKTHSQWSLIGHDWAVEHLQAHIAQGQVRHAYLFTGPDGVGRRTLALAFAKALTCSEPPAPGDFCGVCQNCRQLERMEHPDLAVVLPEEGTRNLKVEQIRELQRGLHLAPYQASYRLALLQDFEHATASTQNALLKTLEEPPPRVILILTASDTESLLPTVASRCEIVRLQPVPLDLLTQKLQSHWGIDPDLASLYAHYSGGKPGLAYQFANDSDYRETYQTRLDDHRRMLNASRAIRFSYAEKLAKLAQKDHKDHLDLQELLQTWLNFWRDVLLSASGARGPLTNPDRLEDIASLGEQVGPEGATQTIQAIDESATLLRGNVNKRLTLEVLMLDLPTIR